MNLPITKQVTKIIIWKEKIIRKYKQCILLAKLADVKSGYLIECGDKYGEGI